MADAKAAKNIAQCADAGRAGIAVPVLVASFRASLVPWLVLLLLILTPFSVEVRSPLWSKKHQEIRYATASARPVASNESG